jgi:excisionase family DNA binding protein
MDILRPGPDGPSAQVSVKAGALQSVHPEMVRRAIRAGALEAAGYAGKRPRLRREEVDRWLHAQEAVSQVASGGSLTAVPVPRQLRSDRRRRVLSEAVAAAVGERVRL